METPMTEPITLTEAQCYEAIERWQDYARFMYWSERGVAIFATNVIEREGKQVTMSIEPDGRVAATRKEDGVKAIYDLAITTAPLRGPATLDNVQFMGRTANSADLSVADQAFFDSVLVFAQSIFQRTVANQFIARMVPETMRVVAHDLALATPKTS